MSVRKSMEALLEGGDARPSPMRRMANLFEGKRITLVPAYGRDYKSKKALQADFDADKDFTIMDMSSRWDGRPANKSALKADGYTEVNIRYKKMRSVAVLKIK
jgi:hypothetical protein